jgi:surface antigen
MRSVIHDLRSCAGLVVAGILAMPGSGSGIAAEPASSWSTTVEVANPPAASDVRALRAALGADDHTAILQALQFTLDEVGDGATYVWRRKDGPLNGTVQPTAAFTDAHGRVCRHVVLVLRLADYTRRMEGIACRGSDKRWSLSG